MVVIILEELDVSEFDTSRVTDMNCMFKWCSSLKKLSINHFKILELQSADEIFDEVSTSIRLKNMLFY